MGQTGARRAVRRSALDANLYWLLLWFFLLLVLATATADLGRRRTVRGDSAPWSARAGRRHGVDVQGYGGRRRRRTLTFGWVNRAHGGRVAWRVIQGRAGARVRTRFGIRLQHGSPDEQVMACTLLWCQGSLNYRPPQILEALPRQIKYMPINIVCQSNPVPFPQIQPGSEGVSDTHGNSLCGRHGR